MEGKDFRMNNWNILLNLASQPSRNRRLYYLLFFFLLTMVALAAFLLVYLNLKSYSDYQELKKNSQALLEKKASLIEENKQLSREIEKYRPLGGLVEEVNALIEKKSFSWLIFFDHLEKALPGQSYLVSISPSATEAGREFRVQVALSRREDLKEFLNNLQSAGFSNLKLLNEVFQNGYFYMEMSFSHAQPD
jgi:Tfp pilus assembly protein PilN